MKFVFLLFLVLHLFSVVQNNKEDITEGSEKYRAKKILMQDNYYDIMDRLTNLENNLTARLASIESKVPQQAVAFKAHLRKGFTPGTNQLIQFDIIQFNLGNAYHHGVFVAPFKGLYLFSVSMCSGGNHWVGVDLMRNDNVIGYVLAGDTVYNDCSSETTLTELEVGDDISVKHHGNSGDYVSGSSEVRDSFTGALISLL